MQLEQVVTRPEYVTVTEAGRSGVADEMLRLTLQLTPDTPAGFRSDAIQLRTNVTNQPDYVIRFTAGVYDDVVPSTPRISFGAVRIGEPFEASFQLNSRSGTPFAIGSVTDSTKRFALNWKPCSGSAARSTCWQVDVGATIDREGSVGGELVVDAEQPRFTIPYAGLVAPPGTRITDLGSNPEGQHSFDPEKEDSP